MWIESDMLPIDTDYKLPNNFRDEILRTIQQRFQISSHGYSLVNIQKTMDNHHFSWINPLFLWPFFQFANCLFLSCTVDMERNPLILSHPPCIIYRYIPHMVLRNELIPLLNRGTIISH